MNSKFALCIGTLVAVFPALAAETEPNIVFLQVDDMDWRQSSVPSTAVISIQPPPGAAKVPISASARGLEWCGVAVEDPGFTLWVASPVRIRKYELAVSSGCMNWTVVAGGELPNKSELDAISMGSPVAARFATISGHAGNDFASLAELAFITA